MSDWNKKTLWTKRSENFAVQVSQHTAPPLDPMDGENRWCVYAYIYPKHPHFAAFSGDSLFQDATDCMPFHGGCSYLRTHLDSDGAVASRQVGADYNHFRDGHYTHMSTKEEAASVFADADELFQWLETIEKRETKKEDEA
jgi:hypothetical protein